MTTSAADFPGHEIGQVSLPPLDDGTRAAFPYSISALTAPGTMQGGADAQLADLSGLKAHPLLGRANNAVSLLKHGHRHLVTLEHNIGQAFALPAEQAVIGAYLDGDTGYHHLRVESIPDLETFAEDFCNAIFDIAGAFRASLDKLAWKAVCSITGDHPKDPRVSSFPLQTPLPNGADKVELGNSSTSPTALSSRAFNRTTEQMGGPTVGTDPMRTS